MEHSEKWQTTVFRVQGLPNEVRDVHGVASLLSARLDDLPVSSIRVYSLATALHVSYSRNPSRTKVATVMFEKVPLVVQKAPAQEEWQLPVRSHNHIDAVSLDTHFSGMTPLNDAGTEYSFDCIAISGLASHPFGSWQPKGDGKTFMWIRDKLPEDLPHGRFILYGYKTRLDNRESFQTIRDLARQFTTLLRTYGWAMHAAKNLIFLAHSLGGLLLREALVQLHKSQEMEATNVLGKTKGAVFFGVPNLGMEQTPFRTITDGSPIAEMIGDIARRSDFLEELNRDFSKILDDNRLRFFWAYETVKSPTLSTDPSGRVHRNGPSKILVTPESATLNLDRTTSDLIFPIHENHSDMVKLKSNSDYCKVVAYKICCILEFVLGDDNCRAFELPEMTTNPDANMQNGSETVLGSPGQPVYLQNGSNGDDTNELANDDEQKLSDTQHKEMIEKLSFKQMDARLMTLKREQEKTCQWLLQHKLYQDWNNIIKRTEHNGFFWIKGKPGSGKSIMMKFLYKKAKMKMKGSTIISFFFNARGEDLEKSTAGLYRSLLCQLLQKFPQTHSALDHSGLYGYNLLLETNSWPNAMLQEAITETLVKVPDQRIVCFIDALDECPEGEVREMITFLEGLGVHERIAEFSTCFSSRHYPEITISKGLQLVLDGEQGHKQDIALYIDQHLKIGTNSQAEDVKKHILEKSSNIFLWVALVIPILNKEFDRGRVKALKKKLGEIPAELHALFLDILQRDNQKLDELVICFQCILFAARPLRPEEFLTAVEIGTETLSDEAYSLEQDDIRKYVLDCSKGLAEIVKSKEHTVQFIHESVRDFLLKDDGLCKLQPNVRNVEGHGHEILKKSCLAQIMTEYRSLDKSGAHASLPNLERKPLLEYAKDNLLFHANRAQGSGVDQTEFLEVFDRELTTMLSSSKQNVHPLYRLAEFGCAKLIMIHPDRGRHFDILGGKYKYPLLAAVYSGSNAAARALLGLTPSDEELPIKLAVKKHSRNPLMKKTLFKPSRHLISILCEYGDVDILQATLQHSDFANGLEDVEMRRECFETATAEAIASTLVVWCSQFLEPIASGDQFVSHGSSEAEGIAGVSILHDLELALRARPTLSIKPHGWGQYNTLLEYAAGKGFENITGICIDHTSYDNRISAMYHAIVGRLRLNRNDRMNIYRLLVDRGVDLKTVQERNPFLLFEAMEWLAHKDDQNDAFFSFLVSQPSIDLEMKRDGWSPLIWALEYGQAKYAMTLLSAGADVAARGRKGKTVLALTMEISNPALFDIVISNPGCDVAARDDLGRTALYSGSGENISKLVKQAQVNPNSRDNCGETALGTAARGGFSLEVVEALLRSPTIEPDLASTQGLTPLMHVFERYGSQTVYSMFKDIVWKIAQTLLLTGKVDPDYRTQYPRTPREHAKDHGLAQLVEMLECFDRCREIGSMDELRDLNNPHEGQDEDIVGPDFFDTM